MKVNDAFNEEWFDSVGWWGAVGVHHEQQNHSIEERNFEIG